MVDAADIEKIAMDLLAEVMRSPWDFVPWGLALLMFVFLLGRPRKSSLLRRIEVQRDHFVKMNAELEELRRRNAAGSQRLREVLAQNNELLVMLGDQEYQAALVALGLPASALLDRKTIDQAYRQMVFRLHPDHGGPGVDLDALRQAHVTLARSLAAHG